MLQRILTCSPFALALAAISALALAAVSGGCTVGPPAPDGEIIPDDIPAFADADFTDSTTIDNRYLPLTPGAVRNYRAETEDGVETIIVEVLEEQREVMGVTCVVVRDQVFLDDVIIEDTHDWYAQDDDGNVWYMGEEVDNYNYDAEGNLIDVTHEGAWEAGKDVSGQGETASPGYVMLSEPEADDVYYQEFYQGEAEDIGLVVEVGVAVTLADGSEYTCLKTRDYTPLEPGHVEFKYYAPGIGVVLEEVEESGERVELESFE